MDFLSNLSGGLMQFASSMSMRIDPKWFVTGSDNAAYLLWQNIQGVTNILLVVILLIVIFSQLTGFGIDNYGIKKMLPKLIVGVLLINLSFVICSIAVDASNLLGSGLYKWLVGIRNSILDVKGYSGGDYAQMTFYTILGVLFGAAGAAGAVAETIVAVAGAGLMDIGWPVILIGLLVAILIALISIFFVFIMLAAREIMCMALVAFSPLAFICYALPNTKKIFDKWLDMLKALLMVYPTIGVSFGLARLLKTVIFLESDNFFELLIAVCLPFVPFFLIPSIAKKALGAVGNAIDKIKNKAVNGTKALGQMVARSPQVQASNSTALENRAKKIESKLDKKVSEANYYKSADKADEKNGETRGADGYARDKDGNKIKAKKFNELTNKDKNIFAGKGKNLRQAYRMGRDRQNAKNFQQQMAGMLGSTGEAYEGEMEQIRSSADEKSLDSAQWGNKNIQTLSNLDELDADGNVVYEEDENGNRVAKKLEAVYDEDRHGWVDAAHPERGLLGAQYKGQIQEALTGKNRKHVEIPRRDASGHMVSEAFDLDENTGKYMREFIAEDGTIKKVEATEREMAAINNSLAKSARLRNYTKGRGGSYVDAEGNALQNAHMLEAAGYSQSYAQMQHMKQVERRASDMAGLTGGYAGINGVALAGAAGVIAENDAMSRANITIGKADALTDIHSLGYNTATSRLAGSQAEWDHVKQAISNNINAMQVDRTSGIHDAFTRTVEVPISINERAKIVNAMKTGRLEEVIRSKDFSEQGKQVAREILASGKDYASFGANGAQATTTELNKVIDSTESMLRETNGILTKRESTELVSAAKNGTLDKLANSEIASASQKAVAQVMLNSGRDYSSFGSSPSATQQIYGEIKELEKVAMDGGASLTTEQKLHLTQSAKNGTLATDYINNSSASALEKIAAQRIIDNSANIGQKGRGSQFIKQNIDSTLESVGNIMSQATVVDQTMKINDYEETVQPEADIVLSVGRTENQIANAIQTNTTKLQNKVKQEIVGDAVGEVELDTNVLMRQAENEYNLKAAKNNIDITPVISASYAQNLEKQRFDIAQEKMYDEGFKLLPKGDLMNLLNGLSTSPFSSDNNYLRSLLKNAQIKCGDDDVAKFVKANQGTMNAEQRVVFDEFFAASRDPLFKAYSKIVGACKEAGVATVNLPTFEQWCTGTAIIPAAAAASKPNYVSMEAYVSSQDEKALAEAEKSSVKIAFSDPNYIRNYSDRQLVYGLIHNKNQEAGIAFREGINGFGSTKRAALIDQIQKGEISSITENAMSTLVGQNISDITTKSQITDPEILSAVDRLALNYNNLSLQMKDRVPDYLVRLFELFYP